MILCCFQNQFLYFSFSGLIIMLWFSSLSLCLSVSLPSPSLPSSAYFNNATSTHTSDLLLLNFYDLRNQFSLNSIQNKTKWLWGPEGVCVWGGGGGGGGSPLTEAMFSFVRISLYVIGFIERSFSFFLIFINISDC